MSIPAAIKRRFFKFDQAISELEAADVLARVIDDDDFRLAKEGTTTYFRAGKERREGTLNKAIGGGFTVTGLTRTQVPENVLEKLLPAETAVDREPPSPVDQSAPQGTVLETPPVDQSTPQGTAMETSQVTSQVQGPAMMDESSLPVRIYTVADLDFSFRDKLEHSMQELFQYKKEKLERKAQTQKVQYEAAIHSAVKNYRSKQDGMKLERNLNIELTAGDVIALLEKHTPEVFTIFAEWSASRKLLGMIAEETSARNWARTRVTKLMETMTDLETRLTGRSDIISDLIQILLAFANSWQAMSKEYMNIIITGPPGIGKTYLAEMIADVFKYSGILVGGEFIEKARQDFVGQHVGESAPLTSATLNAALENVLFIDEAYSLATCHKREHRPVKGKTCAQFDPYSSEVFGVLLPFLTKNVGSIVVIMAGYAREIVDSVIEINPGVERRFRMFWDLGVYSQEELFAVFEKEVTRIFQGQPPFIPVATKNIIMTYFSVPANVKYNAASAVGFAQSCSVAALARSTTALSPELIRSVIETIKRSGEKFDRAYDNAGPPVQTFDDASEEESRESFALGQRRGKRTRSRY